MSCHIFQHFFILCLASKTPYLFFFSRCPGSIFLLVWWVGLVAWDLKNLIIFLLYNYFENQWLAFIPFVFIVETKSFEQFLFAGSTQIFTTGISDDFHFVSNDSQSSNCPVILVCILYWYYHYVALVEFSPALVSLDLDMAHVTGTLLRTEAFLWVYCYYIIVMR